MELKVTSRVVWWKLLKKFRKLDQLPAVVYAKHIASPINLFCRRQDFVKLYKYTGRSTPVTLKWDWVDEMVLVHDIQIDPVTNLVLHVDFLWIKKGEKVTTEVPLVIQWVAPITKLGDARLQQVKDSVHVEAKPADLPHELFVDVSTLSDMNDVIFVKDLVLPSGVEMKDDGDLAVVTIVAVKDVPEEDEETSTETSASDTGDSADTGTE